MTLGAVISDESYPLSQSLSFLKPELGMPGSLVVLGQNDVLCWRSLLVLGSKFDVRLLLCFQRIEVGEFLVLNLGILNRVELVKHVCKNVVLLPFIEILTVRITLSIFD